MTTTPSLHGTGTTAGSPARTLRTVGQVADVSGVTVRTLHHYDAIGLLVPSGRSTAGYRLYTDDDVARLAAVVVHRRLGFGLDEVARLLDADGDERVAHLRRRRAVVADRLDELHALADALDRALAREGSSGTPHEQARGTEHGMTDRPATTEELRELFGDGYDEAYAAEAEQRWGDTDAWRQSRERTARLTIADWTRVKEENEALEADLAAALTAGVDPASAEGTALAERHRRSIEVHYDCSPGMHRALAEMYLADERFTRHYDDRAPGLARWVHDAVMANADRLEAAGD
ncbi:MerR family transcriptional regulator [Cellulomonas marina]|uniref:DNA-binding transcriptional regulator, MerR family n=1 Tax=Cellulomonas marina TaxID=988821 RepID=A0A1I0XH98_9CELL|nr:MerR family transcriptional regulator [Cellulomonas marina]GIG29861.1 MerR family transcriptional regulator [Cellulomonas marina]SFA99680.1 DNA-binding transcriptional regulator, MerR family [Cellulomonas marina]